MNYGDRMLERMKISRLIPKLKWEVRKAFAPLVGPRVALHNAPPFTLGNQSYPYFIDRHNMTWRNERAVELAIASRFVAEQSGNGLEFGNVLFHYNIPGPKTIVDKYEIMPGVLNVDIVDFSPDRPFDYIVSVSTIEHVGWDEKPRDPTKVALAFQRLAGMLAPGGKLLITAPTGHHPDLDRALVTEEWDISQLAMLVRTDSKKNLWTQSESHRPRPYLSRAGRGADGLWVIQMTSRK